MTSCDKPLVSAAAVHGLLIKNMVKNGISISDIDLVIDRYISNQKPRCKQRGINKELTKEEKKRET